MNNHLLGQFILQYYRSLIHLPWPSRCRNLKRMWWSVKDWSAANISIKTFIVLQIKKFKQILVRYTGSNMKSQSGEASVGGILFRSVSTLWKILFRNSVGVNVNNLMTCKTSQMVGMVLSRWQNKQMIEIYTEIRARWTWNALIELFDKLNLIVIKQFVTNLYYNWSHSFMVFAPHVCALQL